MHTEPQQQQRGFIKIIIIIVLALVVLGYLGFNLENIVNSPAVSNNLHYVWSVALTVWNKFLAAPVLFVWNKVVIGIVWESVLKLISLSHGGVAPQ